MTVAIGGTWLAAQGRPSLRELCRYGLELGYDAIVPAPSTRPVPWDQLERTIEDLPLTVPAIRVDPVTEEADGSLASSRADEVLAVRARIGRAAALGERLGVRRLILEAPRVALNGLAVPSEPGLTNVTSDFYDTLRLRLQAERGRYLEAICRNLHSVAGDFPEARFCLTESADLASASDVEDLQEVLTDLARQRIGYWHRPALACRREQLGGPRHAECLERLSKYLVGSDLADSDATGLLAAPGSGGVDYGTLAPYMRALHSKLPTVVELDPACREGEVRQGRAFLEKFGL